MTSRQPEGRPSGGSLFAAGGGARGFGASWAGNALGAVYAAATLAIVAATGAGVLGLSVIVGAFMLLASLHALVPGLAFTPAAFLGYASMFGVHAGDDALIVAGTQGELVATLVAMTIGAGLGWLAERLAGLASRRWPA